MGLYDSGRRGRTIATITKEMIHWTDTYVIDVREEEHALFALMLVLAIDAEKMFQKLNIRKME